MINFDISDLFPLLVPSISSLYFENHISKQYNFWARIVILNVIDTFQILTFYLGFFWNPKIRNIM